MSQYLKEKTPYQFSNFTPISMKKIRWTLETSPFINGYAQMQTLSDSKAKIILEIWRFSDIKRTTTSEATHVNICYIVKKTQQVNRHIL